MSIVTWLMSGREFVRLTEPHSLNTCVLWNVHTFMYVTWHFSWSETKPPPASTMALHSKQSLGPICRTQRTAFKPAFPAPRRQCACIAHSTPEQQQQQQQTSNATGGMALNEDMLAQLRAAQEEAARLKRELEQLQQQKVGFVLPYVNQPPPAGHSCRCKAGL